MTTDTTERGLEELICKALTGMPCDPRANLVADEGQRAYGADWVCGFPKDYNREHCLDLVKLGEFLQSTQPAIASELKLAEDCPARRQFLARLQREIGKRGVIDVLRNGIKHKQYDINLFYGTPSPGNEPAKARYVANRFSVTRQLGYSLKRSALALDLGLFINGLPVATFELKNSLTKQTVEDAVQQYKRDRSPQEELFAFGRCIVHFAVDDHEVRFCTHLKGKASWFLPFNQGWNDGAGNPPNPNGLKTDYLWKEVLARNSLTNIIEHYAQIVELNDIKSRRKQKTQIWPRYHQIDAVRKLLVDVGNHGAGKRYLIQHSAGSGKSNSIAWLAHQLIALLKAGRPVFNSIIIVTDRLLLDKQIRDTVKQFTQVSATVGAAKKSGDLRRFINEGKKIIISTVQKFPFILKEIGNEHRNRTFAIIIDEAHSSQGGKTSAAMAQALSETSESEEDDTFEDKINQLMKSHKLLPNASYFAFTATPKNKTLEIFGEPRHQPDGTTKHFPFHSYTMKQATQEGFILDVLQCYTPVHSFYRLMKTIEADPEFDSRRARKKLRRYVEDHDHAIRLKAEIMVDHFHEQVIAQRKIDGQARAMVITDSINRALEYYGAISAYLEQRKSRYKAIVAFSGSHRYGGQQVTEASINNFSSKKIALQIQEDPYRFLVCADKYQTGYDEPLLHTMYVDKHLSGIKAVQTLSRLNRAHPKKHDVFVLDFANDIDTISEAFADYYRTTILAEQTDPNKLHDLKANLDNYGVYTPAQIDELVKLYLDDAGRDNLDPILDACVAIYLEQLNEDEQVDFKGRAKSFLRTYGFLAQILPYSNAAWEKLSIFLNFLVPKLPAPREDDLSKGILEIIDMDSYRLEKKATEKIAVADQDAEINPLPPSGGSGKPEVEMDLLSNILTEFNGQFGNIKWNDVDRVQKLLLEDIPQRVKDDPKYQKAKENADEQNARVEHDEALKRVMVGFFEDDAELFKQFTDNESFRNWMLATIFKLTYPQQPSSG